MITSIAKGQSTAYSNIYAKVISKSDLIVVKISSDTISTKTNIASFNLTSNSTFNITTNKVITNPNTNVINIKDDPDKSKPPISTPIITINYI